MMKKVFMSFVALLAIAFALPASAMQIYVHYGNGTWPTGTTSLNGSGNLTLEMEASDSFENLKAKIEDKSGLNPAYITLSYGTYDNLPDDGLLLEFGITSGTTLTMTYNPPKYTVTMAPGTEDSTSWSFNPDEAPTTGVVEGTVVNISYGGTRKVKSVVATVVPAAPAALTLNLTSPTVGQVIGSDGKNYAYASLPTGVTALARICYVNGSNGLAMAMADEGQMAWSAAITTCEAHTPAFANGTWKLPTKAEWDNMISASGGISTLREAFSGIGGDNLQYVRYWSATEDESNDSNAYNIRIDDGTWATFVKTNVYRYVRAVLAW